MEFALSVLVVFAVVGAIVVQISVALDQKDRTGSFWGRSKWRGGGLFGGGDDEYVEPGISFFDHFPDVEAPEPAQDVIGEKFSALKVGPFDAQISRQMTAMPGVSATTGSFAVATICSIKMIPVNSFAFQLDFPQVYTYAKGAESLASFYETLSVDCSEPELLSLLQSDQFLAPLRALNALAAGRIAASGDTFAITLFKALDEEDSLNAFFAEAYHLFEKYARILQLNVLEWRRNAAQYDWWAR